MKILFIWPNREAWGYKPLGIALLSAIAKQHGHETFLFDTTFYTTNNNPLTNIQKAERLNLNKPVDLAGHNLTKKAEAPDYDFIRKILEVKPDVISFTVLSDEYPLALHIANLAREYSPAPIIFGGVHPTICPDEVITETVVDYVCIGEGLDAFPELLGNIALDLPTDAIPNIWSKKNGKAIRNPVRPLRQNLDELPYIDWSIFDDRQFLKPYDGKLYRGGEWMNTWGCVGECSYCINAFYHEMYGMLRFIRSYSGGRAIEELKSLKDRYNLNFISFIDEDFLLINTDKLRQFSIMYVTEINLPFIICANPVSVTDEKIQILKNMGCVGISIGVETGDPLLRKPVLNRRDSIESIKKAFALMKEYRIRSSAYIMMGLPHETRASFFETARLLRECNADAPSPGFFYPFKGTKLRDLCMKEGLFDPMATYHRDEPALLLPVISREEMIGLYKTFALYMKFPEWIFPVIKVAENDETVFRALSRLYKMLYQ